jgi:CarD family transcriptional regulator
MTQKKKTSVKATAAKVAAQPKKSGASSSAARTVASNARPVAAAARKPAASVKDLKKPVLAKVTVAAKAPAAPAAKAAPVAKAASAKPAVAAKSPAAAKAPAKTPVTSVKAPAAAAAPAKKAAVPAQPRSEAAKAAQAFAAHRAQAAQASAPATAPARAVPASVSKTSANTKIAAPAKPAAPAVAAKAPVAAKPAAAAPASPKAIAEKAAAARVDANKKPVNSRHGFKTNEFIVYPAHGVGRIIGIEEQEIAGMSLELFVINFEKEKLTLRVPTGKLQSVGMRKLADDDIVKRAMEILKGRARIKRTMWSRRAQEYVAKINSGDLISIAEVVRDLYRSEAQPEQSYSERQLYEDALDRMAREIAAVEKLDDRGAVQRITEVLSKSAKGRRIAEDGAATATDGDEVQAA